MKGLLIVLLLVPLQSHAHGDGVPINSALELREWCEQTSQSWFVGHDLTAHNWTASYWEETNVLKVNGSWRVGPKERVVECRAYRGAAARYAVMEVH